MRPLLPNAISMLSLFFVGVKGTPPATPTGRAAGCAAALGRAVKMNILMNGKMKHERENIIHTENKKARE